MNRLTYVMARARLRMQLNPDVLGRRPLLLLSATIILGAMVIAGLVWLALRYGGSGPFIEGS